MELLVRNLAVIFVLLCIVGVFLWGIDRITILPPIIKVVVQVVVALIILLYALHLVQGMSFRVSDLFHMKHEIRHAAIFYVAIFMMTLPPRVGHGAVE